MFDAVFHALVFTPYGAVWTSILLLSGNGSVVSEQSGEAENSQSPEPTSGDSGAAETKMSAPTADSSENQSAGDPSGAVAGQKPGLMQSIPTMARLLSIAMLILGIVAVGVLFYRVMAGFFVPLFLAVLLVVLFRPVHQWILHRLGNRSRLACLATTTLILSVVLMPIIAVLSVAAGQFTSMVSHVNFEDLTGALQRGREQLGVSLLHPEQFRRLDQLADQLGELDDRTLGLEQNAAEGQVREALMLMQFLRLEENGEVTAEQAAVNAENRLNDLLAAVKSHVIAKAQDDTDSSSERQESVHADAAEDEELSGGLGVVSSDDDEKIAIEANNAASAAVRATDETLSEEEVTALAEHTRLVERIRGKEAFHRKSVIASAAIRAWMREFLGGTFLSQVRLFANPSAEDFKSVLTRARQSLQPRFVTFTSATGSFLVEAVLGLMVLVIAIYFFLHDGASMIRTLMRLSPLDDRYEERLLLEFEKTSRAVVLASIASALGQGVLASVAFYFLGFNSVIFLFLITSLMALVPFLGAAAVWVPCAAYLGAIDQKWGAAIFLSVYGATIVSSIDNVIKMYVLHGRSTMHPLFALLSVLGGVKVFGPIGILVGPMVVVFLQTLLEILNHELGEREQRMIQPVPVSSDSDVNQTLDATSQTSSETETK